MFGSRSNAEVQQFVDRWRANCYVTFCSGVLEEQNRGKDIRQNQREQIMSEKNNNLQDVFLNQLRKAKTPVTMFLVKGVKLQGIITWFDNFSVLLRRDGQSQLIYKHAISTIMPSGSIDLPESDGNGKKPKGLQDVFLNAIQKDRVGVTMFLVNGVMLQGEIGAYDLFCLLLKRDGLTQLVYKHAISTVQPAHPLNLMEEEEAADD
jgi:host factor-I protein